MWFTFRQNNSEGLFVGPVVYYIEAETEEEAAARGEAAGVLYFDGVNSGIDCECCGDRWSLARVTRHETLEAARNAARDCDGEEYGVLPK